MCEGACQEILPIGACQVLTWVVHRWAGGRWKWGAAACSRPGPWGGLLVDRGAWVELLGTTGIALAWAVQVVQRECNRGGVQ